jgi:hypothetical protein
MRRQYLHLSAYSCDKCKGPVIAGSLAVRNTEISKETEIRQVGAVCLSCGHRQSKATKPDIARNFPPIQWESTLIDPSHLRTAFVEALNRAELH